MFTGIVEELGKVKAIVRGSKSIKLSIQCKSVLEDAKLGDSIAVNGICLTVTEIGEDFFTVDVMPETMQKTNLGKLSVTQNVNLERALKITDRLGGHIVSGHIDGIGKIISIKKDDNAIWFEIEASQEILKYIVMKGSITIDGTSLTVAGVQDGSFKVSIIPHTAEVTIIGIKGVGDTVNIECDILAKYIEKFFIYKNEEQNNNKDISLEMLRENGFI